MTTTEYVILVDAENQEIGRAEKMAAHQQNLLHRAFSIFIFRTKPQLELLMTQRSLIKYHSKGLWTNTCCSHPRSGETIIEAGQRRLQEELGFSVPLEDLGWFQYNAHFSNGLSENEIDHVLIGYASPDVNPQPNPEEVHALQWIEPAILQTALEETPNHFTPWFKQALHLCLNATFNDKSHCK